MIGTPDRGLMVAVGFLRLQIEVQIQNEAAFLTISPIALVDPATTPAP